MGRVAIDCYVPLTRIGVVDVTGGQMEWLRGFVIDLVIVTLLFALDVADGHIHAPYRVSPWIVVPLIAAAITTAEHLSQPWRRRTAAKIKQRLMARRVERARRAAADRAVR